MREVRPVTHLLPLGAKWYGLNYIFPDGLYWMAIRGRLSTKDRMQNWARQLMEFVCSVVLVYKVSHLLFQCPFSSHIFAELMSRVGSKG